MYVTNHGAKIDICLIIIILPILQNKIKVVVLYVFMGELYQLLYK